MRRKCGARKSPTPRSLERLVVTTRGANETPRNLQSSLDESTPVVCGRGGKEPRAPNALFGWVGLRREDIYLAHTGEAREARRAPCSFNTRP